MVQASNIKCAQIVVLDSQNTMINLSGIKVGTCADPEGGGGQGVRTPLKNHKNTGFLSNIGPDPL